jgi:hypothetical protein
MNLIKLSPGLSYLVALISKLQKLLCGWVSFILFIWNLLFFHKLHTFKFANEKWHPHTYVHSLRAKTLFENFGRPIIRFLCPYSKLVPRSCIVFLTNGRCSSSLYFWRLAMSFTYLLLYPGWQICRTCSLTSVSSVHSSCVQRGAACALWEERSAHARPSRAWQATTYSSRLLCIFVR